MIKGKFNNEKGILCTVKILNKRQMSIEINVKDQNRIKKDKKNESQRDRGHCFIFWL